LHPSYRSLLDKGTACAMGFGRERESSADGQGVGGNEPGLNPGDKNLANFGFCVTLSLYRFLV